MRFVVNNPRPFIVPVTHTKAGDRVHDGAEPLRTITTAKGGELAIVNPFLATLTHHGGDRVHSLDEPARTVTAANRGEVALVAGALVQTGYGEREGQRPRALDVQEPLGTVVAGGAKHAAVAAFLTKHFGGVVGQKIDSPASTVTAKDHHALTTVTLGASDRRDEVHAFLLKYYGSGESAATQRQSVTDPLHTITTKARFGLVVVEGVEYAIADIGMRMLDASELWRAQGFENPDVTGITKTDQVKLCGNSVSPPVAEAIVRANFTRAARVRRVA
jgi:DNA (cytosine-5)-methyltransferase 1